MLVLKVQKKKFSDWAREESDIHTDASYAISRDGFRMDGMVNMYDLLLLMLLYNYTHMM